jgi:hypothetical protein
MKNNPSSTKPAAVVVQQKYDDNIEIQNPQPAFKQIDDSA